MREISVKGCPSKGETRGNGHRPRAPGEGAAFRKEAAVEPFASALGRRGLSLVRGETDTLQVNTGLLCNLRCRHCHLDAGPGRSEVMSRETMEAVIDFAGKFPFRLIDITGGAPEMVPGLSFLLEGLARLTPRLVLRTNLSALGAPGGKALLDLCVALRVALAASLPSTDPSRTDAQRGAGAAEEGIAMLRALNGAGYGVEGSGLTLDLVSNPVGAHLPPPRFLVEERFRRDLTEKRGIAFSGLHVFANVPLGRFREWLLDSGKYGRYMDRLASSFNPRAVSGLMCRTLLSVSWDGILHDCDFNLAARRPLSGRGIRVSEVLLPPPAGTPIAVGDHCYACAAGSGFI